MPRLKMLRRFSLSLSLELNGCGFGQFLLLICVYMCPPSSTDHSQILLIGLVAERWPSCLAEAPLLNQGLGARSIGKNKHSLCYRPSTASWVFPGGVGSPACTSQAQRASAMVCPRSAAWLAHRRSVCCFWEVLCLQHSPTVTDPSDTS